MTVLRWNCFNYQQPLMVRPLEFKPRNPGGCCGDHWC